MNKEIAYKGTIGRQRQDFCVRYIEHKQLIFKEAEQQHIKIAKENGETISCHKGCSYCCTEYISASLQECEAIVYYLYQNESVLIAFLQAYPRWWAQVEKNQDLLKRIEQLAYETLASELSRESQQALARETEFYTDLNIACPFLSNDICSIYEVRPRVCACIFVTTPAEWCNPLNPNSQKVKTYFDNFDDFIERPFYYNDIIGFSYMLNMPYIVYGILIYGILYLSKFPGLEDLARDLMSDPEARAVLKRFRTSRS